MVDMYKIFQSSKNPMDTLREAAGNSTEFNTILQMTQAANGDPKQAFYAKAKGMGLTDEEINDGLFALESNLGIKRPG